MLLIILVQPPDVFLRRCRSNLARPSSVSFDSYPIRILQSSMCGAPTRPSTATQVQIGREGDGPNHSMSAFQRYLQRFSTCSCHQDLFQSSCFFQQIPHAPRKMFAGESLPATLLFVNDDLGSVLRSSSALTHCVCLSRRLRHRDLRHDRLATLACRRQFFAVRLFSDVRPPPPNQVSAARGRIFILRPSFAFTFSHWTLWVAHLPFVTQTRDFKSITVSSF